MTTESDFHRSILQGADAKKLETWNQVANSIQYTVKSTDIEEKHSDNLRTRYHTVANWRPKEIPEPDFIADISLPLSGQMIKNGLLSNIPNILELGNGSLDFSRAIDRSVRLGCKKDDSCKWTQHNIDLTITSGRDPSRRVRVSYGALVEELDSIGISLIPTVTVNADTIYIGLAAEINWVQNADWQGAVLIAANEYCRSVINPSLPNPILSAEFPFPGMPEGKNVKRTAVRIVGCPYEVSPGQPVSQDLVILFAFA